MKSLELHRIFNIADINIDVPSTWGSNGNRKYQFTCIPKVTFS